MLWMDQMEPGPPPKRGDIVQTNIGNARERTWMILYSRLMRRRTPSQNLRFKLWAVRWWELEADFRMRLYRSAERAGGQSVFYFYRYSSRLAEEIFGEFYRIEQKPKRWR